MIRKAIKSDIEKIKSHIEEFNLDSEDMDHEKFYVFEYGGIVAGFGRYKNYGNYCEIATIGVLKPFRNRGIGKTIVNQLIKSVPFEEIWLTTVIPDFFKKFGFKKSQNVPEELLQKTRRICEKFEKSEEFSVFMKLKKQT
ncbi:MAG: hypothetical protein A2Y25_04655 [Candidatus Melainabacteria bacterium GWF2_37_15]|nr:MAG: hypothetical protein A2Y25_04655 [Candidatus Melainabacteria bacterium GWF2_37_15]